MTADDSDHDDRGESPGSLDRVATMAASSTYKMLGQFAAANGAGVLGNNTAGSGTPIGVEGAVPNSSTGYGLSTPHDARIEGVLDTNGTNFVVAAGHGKARNVVIGDATNEATASGGATIGGGGDNTVGAQFGTVGGGRNNTARSGFDYGTISGGTSNVVDGASATVGGGQENNAVGKATTVAGGWNNAATAVDATVAGGKDNTASGDVATVAGGIDNTASAQYAAVGGGRDHVVSGTGATAAGGLDHEIAGDIATVAGGFDNIADGKGATIGGGEDNVAKSGFDYGTISGGTSNMVIATYATVGGGEANVVTSGSEYGTIAGGGGNAVTGTGGTIPGGLSNKATTFAFAAGANARADAFGSYVWADTATDSNNDVLPASATSGPGPTGVDTFHVRCTGGARFISEVDNDGIPTNGVKLAANDGTWQSLSARAAKTDIEPVAGPDVLSRVEDLPVSTWRYDGQDESVRHMGPMAGDFHDAFGLGTDEETVAALDLSGVALAAIKGLSREVDAKADRIDDLAATVERKDDRIEELERETDRIDDLEAEAASLREENEQLRERLAALEAQVATGTAAADD
jgi:hypothetical protein